MLGKVNGSGSGCVTWGQRLEETKFWLCVSVGNGVKRRTEEVESRFGIYGTHT